MDSKTVILVLCVLFAACFMSDTEAVYSNNPPNNGRRSITSVYLIRFYFLLLNSFYKLVTFQMISYGYVVNRNGIKFRVRQLLMESSIGLQDMDNQFQLNYFDQITSGRTTTVLTENVSQRVPINLV